MRHDNESEYTSKKGTTNKNSVPRRARRKMSSSVKKGNSLKKWIVCKHGKFKRFLLQYNHQNNNNNTIITNKQLNQQIKLRRQQQHRQQLILHGHKVVHEELKGYMHPYSIFLNPIIVSQISRKQ